VHAGGFCAEVCPRCIAGDDFDDDELGIDPEDAFE